MFLKQDYEDIISADISYSETITASTNGEFIPRSLDISNAAEEYVIFL